jgi:hypothetical protein
MHGARSDWLLLPASSQVYALGFVSVFDQILDGFDAAQREKVFAAYVEALGESPATYRVRRGAGSGWLAVRRWCACAAPVLAVDAAPAAPVVFAALTSGRLLCAPALVRAVLLQADAEAMEVEARGLNGPDGLLPDASGTGLQQALAEVKAATDADKFAYNRFFAVGLFRCARGGLTWARHGLQQAPTHACQLQVQVWCGTTAACVLWWPWQWPCVGPAVPLPLPGLTSWSCLLLPPPPPGRAPSRLLELTGAKEPAALEKLVNAVGVKPASVNKDLLMYKGVLSKLSAAKVRLQQRVQDMMPQPCRRRHRCLHGVPRPLTRPHPDTAPLCATYTRAPAGDDARLPGAREAKAG